MLPKLLTLIICIDVSCRVNAEFPDDPMPCNYGDSDCIIKLIEYFTAQKYEGDESIDMLPIDPLTINKLHISKGGDGPMNVDLMFINGRGYGLKTAKVVNITGFRKEISTKHEIVAKADKLNLIADYTLNGKMLILPLSGSGKSNITLIKPTFTIGWMGVPYEKNGGIYMKLDKHYVNIDTESLSLNFENLFYDKALSDNTNLFLAENWRDYYPELRDSVGNGFSQITRKVLNRVFAKHPYKKYFLNNN